MLADRGVDLSGLEATIPADLEFPLYKNAFRMLFVYAYLFAAGAKRCGVAATAADGRLTLVFRSSKGSVVRHLRDSLTDDKAPLPFATGRGDDTAFEVGALRGFVAQALEQLAPEMSYAEDRSEFSLTFAAAPCEEKGDERKIVLMLEDRDEMYWFVSELLSSGYVVRRVPSIRRAVEFLSLIHI